MGHATYVYDSCCTGMNQAHSSSKTNRKMHRGFHVRLNKEDRMPPRSTPYSTSSEIVVKKDQSIVPTTSRKEPLDDMPETRRTS